MEERPAGGADPAERLIARLYRSALAVPPEAYRAWALTELGKLIPHDGALWGSGTVSRWKFHTRTVVGLPEAFPAQLEATRHINPLLPRLIANLDNPLDMESVLSDEAFHASEIYKQVFEPHGIQRILSTAHMERRSGLYSLLTLYRRDPHQHFTDDEKRLQARLTFHLFNAGSHAYFLHLMRRVERPAQAAAAVVDGHGLFHEAQPRFLDLLEEHYAGRAPTQGLPFTLPAPGQPQVIGALCVRSEPLADLFVVHLWPAGPLDRLTAREREIVHAVAQGLSFKQAARKIGVAPSTVANHLYRVYRKLGVYSRTELAALVYPEG
ncbi:MAG TPA: LuxR C-terminal-related transcriptional regulator [Nevskiaceae bacterium]|nr:LuxR C-terminal-related transcriptional regulator [Nevskiaceae bacterium]